LFKDKETDYVAQNEEEISAYVAISYLKLSNYIINNGTGLDLLRLNVKVHTKAI
jgi:hypothetical protein